MLVLNCVFTSSLNLKKNQNLSFFLSIGYRNIVGILKCKLLKNTPSTF